MNLREITKGTIFSLIASILTLAPVGLDTPASAAVNPGLIEFNDLNCDLSSAGYLGTGAPEDPYQISDSDSLWEVADCSITGSDQAHFAVTSDIDVTQAQFAPTTSPVGLSTSGSIEPFRGFLSGNGHYVYGIHMSSSTTGVGLFAKLEDATIRNLSLGGSVAKTAESGWTGSAGALAGWSQGHVFLEEITNSALVSGIRTVGGLIGLVQGTIEITRSSNEGEISGEEHVGGLVGWAHEHATISYAINYATVSAQSNEAGGLIGYTNMSSYIVDSVNRGAVRADAIYGAGGFIGFAEGPTSLVRLTNFAAIASSASAGGLVGFSLGTLSIESSQNIGQISASEEAGGLVGESDGALTITNGSNERTVTATRRSGGMVGLCKGLTTLSSVRNNAAIHAIVADAGGLIGKCDNDVVIQSASNNARVTAYTGAGGLASEIQGAISVQDSENFGDVELQDFGAGGLVGEALTAEIYRSTNSGNVSGFDSAGGILGWVANLSVSNVANLGDVGGHYFTGGIVGLNAGSLTISQAVNFGSVTGNEEVGGILGAAYPLWNTQLTISNSRNHGQILGTYHVAGIVGRAADAFKLELSQVVNSATISATGNWAGGLIGASWDQTTIFQSQNNSSVTGADDVGGLLGWTSASSTIIESFNLGSIRASMSDILNRTESAGGLIGNAQSPVAIESSFNFGPVSSRLASGGFVGFSYVEVAITTSYNVGVTTTLDGQGSDGFVGRASNSNVLAIFSSFSTMESNFASPKTVAEMRIGSTYTSWDFSSQWGFGSCVLNNGFPVLRFANQAQLYHSVGCDGVVPTSVAVGPIAATLPEIPRFDKAVFSGIPGQLITLTGANLANVHSARIADRNVTLSSVTSRSITVELPALDEGRYDLAIITSEINASYLGLIEILRGPTQLETEPEVTKQNSLLLRGLNPNSRWLNKLALAQIASHSLNAGEVVCIAYNNKPGLISRQKALSRATQACNTLQNKGLAVRVFVYGKAPHLAETVKILSR